MKNIIKLLFGTFLAAAFLTACEKDENKVFYEGGTSPVIKSSIAGPLVLTDANKSNVAVKFDWTNPNYNFTTGGSSQDVTYILQIDTTGSNFTNPKKQEASISKELAISYTVKEFNTFFNKMELQYGMPHNIEFRIKATLANGTAAVLYSNVIKMVVTPYLDVAIPVPVPAELYITGNGVASDWTNSPPANQKFTKVSETEYTITVALIPGKEIKFLSKSGSWQPQYGKKKGSGGDSSGGELGLNNTVAPYDSDPDSVPTPSVAGTYKITLKFITGTYKIEKV